MSLVCLVTKIQHFQLNRCELNLDLGDTIRVGVLIQEGSKQRIQTYQGVLIAQHRAQKNSTVTLRRTFQGVGIERIFLLNSPLIQDIEVLRSSKVRRAKLYYIRSRKGKATRLQERFKKVAV